jgi:hypothetical protein
VTLRAPRLGHVRMQAGWRGIWRGFERTGSRFLSSWWIGIKILLATGSMGLWLVALGWLAADRHWAAAGGFALLPTVILWRWYGGPWALATPLAICGMLPVVWNGFIAALTGRRVEWKGRTV